MKISEKKGMIDPHFSDETMRHRKVKQLVPGHRAMTILPSMLNFFNSSRESWFFPPPSLGVCFSIHLDICLPLSLPPAFP